MTVYNGLPLVFWVIMMNPEYQSSGSCAQMDTQPIRIFLHGRTEGLHIHQCAKKIPALQTVLETKREEFVVDALINAKSLCKELEISFEPPRRIRRKHIFGNGSKEIQLLYEEDLRRTMFSSIVKVSAEIRERFQRL
ncbi:uncharacterized protein TNCV_4542271 [Trichonephila clavipes]|nr:uncharacterized protein TNCV_4542271 [Trichonephila clavipes]